METPKIFEGEYRFCQILWAHEPVKSRELVALCAEHLGWKPTTTYTVIKRLSERGVPTGFDRSGIRSQKFSAFPSCSLSNLLEYICTLTD